MEVSSSSIPNCGGEGIALRGLLEAFGSMFTFEEIASAYCNASKNADLAGQILCDIQRSSSSSSSSSSVMSNGEVRDEVSLDPAYGGIPKKSCNGNGKSKTGKQKWRPVSMRTVTGVLGKDYVNPSPVNSMFTFEETASVYCNPSKNAALAGEIRCDMQGSSSSSSSSSVMSNGEVRDNVSLEPPDNDIPKKSCHGNGKSRTGKQKWRPVSMGSVTGVVGKDCVNPSSVTSMFNFEDTASVYCNASKNAALAGEIRCDMQGSSSSSSSSSVMSNGEVRDDVSLEPPDNDIPKKSCHGNGKQKWRPVSMGTVTGVLGKDYVNPSPVTSMFTFEETASVYCNASKNAALAGEIRCDMQGSSSSSSYSSVMSNGEVRDDVSLEPPDNDIPKKSCHGNGKQKWRPISMGTVTGVLGKDYVNPSPVTSMFTFEETASVYCNASKNAALAGEIRCDMQGSSSSSSYSSVMSNGEVRDDVSLEPPDNDIPKKSCHGNGKQKWRPVSMGTVTGVLGKDYGNPSPVTNASWIATKPLKLDVKEAPVPGICEEATNTNLSKEARMHEDMEDFLFRILGDGFKLDRETIRKVLDTCGYDIGKSMDKLIDMSAAVWDQKNEYAGKSTQKFTCSNPGVSSHYKKGQASTSHGGVSNPSEEELQEQEKARHKLGKEVLTALFSPADRSEVLPRRIEKAERRGMPYGEPVVAPPRAPILKHEAEPVSLQQPNDYDEGDKSYQLLLKAVRENRVTMREYYKAAVDSFAKGDNDRANKLLEKGQFFREKALEADNESSQMIFGRDDDSKDEIKLDLHEHDAKEAIRTLKCHLSSLAGIPSFKYLKLIIDANGEDSTKGARRRFVVKLLEKESIKWTEGTDAGTIMIHLETINPRSLSFVNK